jgi:outer membrane protein assembly factor BamB
MNSEDIVLLGVKGMVIAFERRTGRRLWQQQVNQPRRRGDYVSLIADTSCVYAHSGGEVACFDLLSGRALWQDGSAGLGYGIASLTIPGGPSTSSAPPKLQQQRESDSAAATATHSA